MSATGWRPGSNPGDYSTEEHTCSWYCRPAEGVHATVTRTNSDGDTAGRSVRQAFVELGLDVLSCTRAYEFRPVGDQLPHGWLVIYRERQEVSP